MRAHCIARVNTILSAINHSKATNSRKIAVYDCTQTLKRRRHVAFLQTIERKMKAVIRQSKKVHRAGIASLNYRTVTYIVTIRITTIAAPTTRQKVKQPKASTFNIKVRIVSNFIKICVFRKVCISVKVLEIRHRNRNTINKHLRNIMHITEEIRAEQYDRVFTHLVQR